MYTTTKQKRRYLISTIILAIGIPLTAIAAYIVTNYITGASGSVDPKNVVISNVTSNSATISWMTDGPATSSVHLTSGTSSTSPITDVRGAARRKTHYIEIANLNPSTEYTFKIKSNTDDYATPEGGDFKFKTTPVSTDTPIPSPVYGSVIGASGDDAIVFLIVEDSSVYPASAIINSSGNWILDLSALRNNSADLVKVESDSNVALVVYGHDGQGAKVSGPFSQVFAQDGKLNSTHSLSLNVVADLSSSFPAMAKITSQIIAIGTGGGNDEPTTPTAPTQPTTPTEPEEEPEEETGNERVFRLVLDVNWDPIENTVAQEAELDLDFDTDSVQITNLTDTSFTVVWLTKEKVEGSVRYGTSPGSLSATAIDERDGLSNKKGYHTHSVKLTQLLPQTKYYFEIVSGSSVLQNNGTPFSATTFSTLSTPPEFKTLAGKVTGISDLRDTVILGQLSDANGQGGVGNSTVSSAVPNENGNWILSLGDVRNTAGSAYFTFTDEDKITVSPTVFGLADPITETAAGLEEKAVTVSVKGASDTDKQFVAVAPLANYGVFGASDSNLPANAGGGNLEDIDTGGITPETASIQGLLGSVALGGLLLFAGVLFTRRKTKTKVEKSMMDSIF